MLCDEGTWHSDNHELKHWVCLVFWWEEPDTVEEAMMSSNFVKNDVQEKNLFKH